jgi:hypothetical protein
LQGVICVEAVLPVPITLWRQSFETLGLPVVDSIPSTLSPLRRFYVFYATMAREKPEPS